MTVNFRCKKCGQVFDCEVGEVGVNEETLELEFEKPIVCPRCGKRTNDQVLLTERGQSQVTAATWE